MFDRNDIIPSRRAWKMGGWEKRRRRKGKKILSHRETDTQLRINS